jgi:hypothetical protein
MKWCDVEKMLLRIEMLSSPALWPYLENLQRIIPSKPNQPVSANKIQAIIQKIEVSRLPKKDQILVENLIDLVEIIRIYDDRINSKKESIKNLDNKNLWKNSLQKILFHSSQEGVACYWERTLMELSKKVSIIHRKERKTKKLRGALYEVTCSGYFIIIGDIHGDIHSLWQILENEFFFEDTHKKVIFLGDYIDNGPHQLATLFLPLLMKFWYPERVYLLKGNHEHLQKTSRNKIVPLIYGSNLFFEEFKGFLSQKCLLSIYNTLMDLPVVLEFNRRTGIVHGGLPRPSNEKDDYYPQIHSLNDLNNPDRLTQMLWNRPTNKSFPLQVSEATDFETSQPHFEAFLDKMGWDYMIRGHCPEITGFNTLYDERMFTIYSTGNVMSGYGYIRPVYAVLNASENNDNPVRTTLTIKRVYKTDDLDQIVFTKVLKQNKVYSNE